MPEGGKLQTEPSTAMVPATVGPGDKASGSGYRAAPQRIRENSKAGYRCASTSSNRQAHWIKAKWAIRTVCVVDFCGRHGALKIPMCRCSISLRVQVQTTAPQGL